jgi:hypothetical protein
MSLNRHAAKRDGIERAIIRTWEAMGAYVESVSGPGLADTLVHHKGRLYRAEVKGAKRGLTPKQVENFTKAHGADIHTFIIRSPEDARTLLTMRDDPDWYRLIWTPEHGALAGASRKERAFRPGTDKARTLAESCKVECCITSAVPGSSPPRCAAHLAEETFAPEITVTADAGARRSASRKPGRGLIRAPRTEVGHLVEEALAPPTCPACNLDPQSPCKYDGEEKGVASGTQPPRRKNLRKVDAIVRAREETERLTAEEGPRRSDP